MECRAPANLAEEPGYEIAEERGVVGLLVLPGRANQGVVVEVLPCRQA